PQAGGPLSRIGQFPQTRFNGATSFSSGFGTRIDIAAPSDGIVALAHVCTQDPCTPQDAIAVLSGGTSASAPMVAAAAAVVIQAARLTHKKLSPWQVREVLVCTARPLAQAPQSPRVLWMGGQLDVTAALESVIGADGAPSIARLSIAHRRELGGLGAAFREDADPAAIDLSGPVDFSGNGSGQWLAGPITIAADVVNATSDLKYALIVAGAELLAQDAPAFRLLPAEILSAAGLPIVSASPRAIDVRLEARRRGRSVASAGTQLVLGPSDGLISEPLAPVVPPVAVDGEDVLVRYDVSGLRYVDAPTLFVSGIGHFSPSAAPIFHVDTEIALKGASGDVRVPASAFRGGAGLYGIGIRAQAGYSDVGQIAVIRIAAAAPGRPDAPTVADASGQPGHFAGVTRAGPKFTLRWNASALGDGAALEISAPAPTLRNSYNTFTNANGSGRDANGVDSPSALLVPLPSASGEKAFDAVKIGLAPALFYNLRVFATRAGRIASEASPTSALEVDDLVVPAGTVTSFDLAGEASLASTATPDALGNLAATSLLRWSPRDAAAGATLSSDATGSSLYEVFGTDAGAGVGLAVRWPWTSSVQTIETWDARGGRRLASVDVDAWAQDWLYTARVDPLRHRAAFLAYDPNFAPMLLPFDLLHGALGAPVPGPQAGFYNTLTLDPLTGKAYTTAAAVTEFCIFASGPVSSVDLDTGEIESAAIASCATGIVADGRKVHVTQGPIISNNVLLPIARLQDVDERTMNASKQVLLGARSPLFPAVDAANQLLVVAFLAGGDYELNSNATSAVGAYDLRSGKRVFYSTSFNFAQAALGTLLDPLSLRGIQLDPSTRTGWTFGPGSTQLQRFSY
ncbi:MAG: S8 family serine peptidase, partial [Myxococcales bacterium]